MADLKTKIFTGILSSTMVFTSLPALISHADTIESDDTVISIEKDDGDFDPNAPLDSGYCGTNYAFWSLDRYGTLFISGDKGAKMNNYKKIGEAPWYKYKDQITCIYVMGGITNIGNYAFANMYGFIRIDEATDLKTIGSYAFSGDSRLKTVYIQKTKKLKKKKVKKSLKGSSIKTVKVKKSKVKTYKKYFTKKNCGRKVKVKK